MELKEYQHRTLEAFDRWRKALTAEQDALGRRARALGGDGLELSAADRNFPRTAWEKLTEQGEVAETAGPYVERTDGVGRPIPHVCFKIPTGGGKTLLGAAALERLGMQTGLALWIVPTRAIYKQTKAAFWNREHPYRQMLERASGGRVKMLEKDDPFTRQDIDSYLCVMLLMLPAANRRKHKEFLRMFRDSGRYPTLFPASDDARASDKLLADYPDLERSAEGTVKHSLFNAFKLLRPVVVLDEAHKAYGKKEQAAKEYSASINHFNPRLVIELSATPSHKISNLLVDISGVDLKKEAMIKLPIEIKSVPTTDWQGALAEAEGKLDELESEAQSLDASEGRYIRPIAVVRVERTGKDQRSHDRIHAEDVREYLTQQLGVAPGDVRVKTSEKDEIANEDLLSECSTVRWIITKAALMEGWDCPFAYLLVMLDNIRSQKAITQLMGRVMRQPHARRTDREALDRCYVYCWQTTVDTAVKQVKSGLEREGLTGLGDDVFGVDAAGLEQRTIYRRAQFRNRDIFLPKVLHTDGDGWRALDYQRHILSAIPWDSIQAPSQPALPNDSDGPSIETIEVDLGDSYRPSVTREALEVDTTVTLDWFTRQITDLVPNPWQAARIAAELIKKLRDEGLHDEAIYQQRRLLASLLREDVATQIERKAEDVFSEKLRRGEIRFNLEAGKPNFRMYDDFPLAIARSDPTLQQYGEQIQLSLFEPVLDRQFDSDLERRFAFYLDQPSAIQWWHRIAVRQQYEYYLRGWKPDRIWPDFIAMSTDSDKNSRLLIVETKGRHLDNEDTDYKRRVFRTLEDWLNRETVTECGTVTVDDGPAKGKFTIVFTEEDFPLAIG